MERLDYTPTLLYYSQTRNFLDETPSYAFHVMFVC